MKVENDVLPNQDQLEGLLDGGAVGPIYMINLLKFKDKAVYEDGRATDLSGEAAYGIYWEAVSQVLADMGGGAMFNAPVQWLMMGEVEDLWDTVAVAMYPSRQSILEMIQSDKMKDIGVHRDAGLAGQLNIETSQATGRWLET